MRQHRRLLSALCLVAGIVLAWRAAPAQDCRVDLRPIVFGEIDPTRTSRGRGLVIVRCDRPAEFFVELHGNGGERAALRGADGNRLPYRLSPDPSYGTVWGDGRGTGNAVRASNDGQRPTRLRVYALVPPHAPLPPGQYRDSLDVRLRY